MHPQEKERNRRRSLPGLGTAPSYAERKAVQHRRIIPHGPTYSILAASLVSSSISLSDSRRSCIDILQQRILPSVCQFFGEREVAESRRESHRKPETASTAPQSPHLPHAVREFYILSAVLQPIASTSSYLPSICSASSWCGSSVDTACNSPPTALPNPPQPYLRIQISITPIVAQ